MGDRANVYCVDEFNPKTGVYLYTHWRGEELAGTVQTAIARRQRWSDGAYLNRIIFAGMIAGQEKEETGYGISAHICDNSHPIVVVDVKNQKVGFAKEGKEPVVFTEWTFEEYVDLKLNELQIAWDV